MTLVLHQQVETTLPIEVRGVTPDQLASMSNHDIKNMPIGLGGRDETLQGVFDVSGQLQDNEVATPTIKWTGQLKNVHWLGANMKSGCMQVASSVGRHLGSQMTGGEIIVSGNASDHVGAEMTGGSIRVVGDVGDLAGANYPGSKFGMNRGSIFIQGDAGKGTGQSMRRGTIVVGGDCGSLAGWDMLAGTIVVFGSCGQNVGIGMVRGTIVLAKESTDEAALPSTFRLGGTCSVPVIRLLARWLQQQAPEFDSTKLMNRAFAQYHGDALKTNRGEIFVAVK